jgi:predicted PurR-regulated permease PerM
MDRVASFFSERTPRRVLALGVFLALLWLFRSMALLLVFFVVFERGFGFLAAIVASRTKWPKKRALLALVAAFVSALGALVWLGVGKSVKAFGAMQTTFPQRVAELRENPLVVRIEEQLGGTEKLVEGAKHYAGSALSAASTIGHVLVHVLIGFILAIVYLLEEEEIGAFYRRIDRRSLAGTLIRWFGHVADAMVVTAQLQVIVALFNTVTTLPVLLVLGVPHVGPLMLLVFVSAFVPVIGNIAAGTVLSLLAYQAKGWLGVGIFIGLTFILHKIESYYLSPRLTARHVRLPGFVLIVSLLACEHLFGFKGLFLSFPILFVAGRIHAEQIEEDQGATASGIALSDGPE